MGPLNLAMFHQSKYLIPKCNIRLKLTRAKEEFCTMSFGKSKVKVEVKNVWLRMRTVNVNPPILQAHIDGLQQHNAIYPLQRNKLTTITLPKGTQTETRPIIISDNCPKLVVIGFVSNAAFHGDYEKNPFNFHHYNLSHIALIKNGVSSPFEPMEMDFANKKHLVAYTSMIQNMEMYGVDDTNGLTVKDYAKGNSLFCFNLTPDLNYGGNCGQLYEQTNIRLDLQFTETLPESINVIIFTVNDGAVEITGNGQVHSS